MIGQVQGEENSKEKFHNSIVATGIYCHVFNDSCPTQKSTQKAGRKNLKISEELFEFESKCT